MRVILNLPVCLPRGTELTARFDTCPRVNDHVFVAGETYRVTKVFWPTYSSGGLIISGPTCPPVVYLAESREPTESEARHVGPNCRPSPADSSSPH